MPRTTKDFAGEERELMPADETGREILLAS